MKKKGVPRGKGGIQRSRLTARAGVPPILRRLVISSHPPELPAALP